MTVRLQKVLARAGIASRRAAEDLIRSGRVSVNGRIVTTLGTKADPFVDEVRLDGERIRMPIRFVYLMGHKPPGVLTSMGDPPGRACILTVWPALPKGVFPVGRLDFNSSGLLLLTNDGGVAQALLHPRYKITKKYRVKVRGIPREYDLARLKQGLPLEDGMTAPAAVRVIRKLQGKSWLEFAISEGRFRQVRRMCEAVRLSVEKLVRTEFGPLALRDLRCGELRFLTRLEVEKLKRACSDASGDDRTGRSKKSARGDRRASPRPV